MPSYTILSFPLLIYHSHYNVVCFSSSLYFLIGHSSLADLVSVYCFCVGRSNSRSQRCLWVPSLFDLSSVFPTFQASLLTPSHHSLLIPTHFFHPVFHRQLWSLSMHAQNVHFLFQLNSIPKISILGKRWCLLIVHTVHVVHFGIVICFSVL